MCDVQIAIKITHFAEGNVFFADFEAAFEVMNALKPDQVHHTRCVAQFADKALFPALAHHAELAQNTTQLHLAAVRRKSAYLMEFGLVHVSKRKMKKQVAKGKNAQFLAQQITFGGSNAFQVFDRAVEF